MRNVLLFFVFASICLYSNAQNSKQTINSLTKTNVEPELAELSKNFIEPSIKYRPETWFHINGNNISKEGLTLDLEAVKNAGLQGIHLFNKSGGLYPGVEPIKILSPEWEGMIRHAADECKRLGLKFTMQNCPGWSMTGGPWVPVEEAQREVVETVYRLKGNSKFNDVLKIDSLYNTNDYNFKDIQLIAFPTPKGDNVEAFNPNKVETNNKIVPWKEIFNPASKVNIDDRTTKLDLPLDEYRKEGISKVNAEDSWVKVVFEKPVTLRSMVLPAVRHTILNFEYPRVDVSIKVETLVDTKLVHLTTLKIPDVNWSDRQLFLTLAIPETTSTEFKFTFEGSHSIAPEFIRLYAKPRLHNHEAKAAKALRSLEKDVVYDYNENEIIKVNQIVNLSDKMSPDGKLTWNVPPGDWTVVRFGHINMRRTNKPAVPEATGWESSKLDKLAIENHLRNGMIGNLIKDGGPIGDGKLHGLLIDSWESFIPTWTMNSEDLFKEFETRRGYSMKPYLPATMGYIVESPKASTKFLRDLRNTMDDVYVENFFKHFATIAHEMGAEVYTEAAGGEVLPIDPLRYYGVSDVPMTEFWYPKAPSNQNTYSKPIYAASSATHLYNKPFLAAETATQLNVKWNEHPFSIKYLIDFNFTKGVNHLVFHTFSHTPQTNVFPGSSFGGNIGFPFVRQQTWWPYMADFNNYLARNQFILQQGNYAADVLWYLGDHFERPPYDLDYFPKGYRFDYLNAEILQEKLSVKNGEINVEGAGNYKVILLKDSKDMLLSTAKKLRDLVLEGAVIVGDKPTDSPSLMDNEAELKELNQITTQLWDNSQSGVKHVGKGKVYWGKTLDEVLKLESITPDVIVPEGLDVNWIHRKTDDADIYFIASKMDTPVNVALSFRLNNVIPQIWNAHTGKQQIAHIWKSENNRTNVALSLNVNESVVLVFTKGTNKSSITRVTQDSNIVLNTDTGWFKELENQDYTKIFMKDDKFYGTKSGVYKFYQDKEVIQRNIKVAKSQVNQDWKLNFAEGWDTPEVLEIPALLSLTQINNEAIKHYSGTVTYTKSIDLHSLGKHTSIDLGQVANIAELWCNGEKIGVKWAPPFVFDISGAVKKGKNELVVKVTNTWRNQLIYDNTRAKEAKKTWTSNPPKSNEIELEESGLIGPVIIEQIR